MKSVHFAQVPDRGSFHDMAILRHLWASQTHSATTDKARSQRFNAINRQISLVLTSMALPLALCRRTPGGSRSEALPDLYL